VRLVRPSKPSDPAANSVTGTLATKQTDYNVRERNVHLTRIQEELTTCPKPLLRQAAAF
jgi:hypothetical protein